MAKNHSITMLDLSDEASKHINQAQSVSISMMADDNFKHLNTNTISGLLWSITDRLDDLQRINNQMWELYKKEVNQ